jgi:UDP-glucuronate 4-epimerase
MYLITGVAGFIGMHFAKKMLDKGYKVLGVDNLNDYYDTKLKKNRVLILKKYKNFKFLKSDLKSLNTYRQINKSKISHIVHLAGQAGVRYSIKNPGAYVNDNIMAYVNLLEAFKYSKKLKCIVYASSSSVYGKSREHFSKNYLLQPISMYAATKMSMELISNVYLDLYKMKSIGIRFFTVYGPYGRPDMAYYKFCNQIKKNETIKVFNMGKHKRSFTYIDDAVNNLYLILKNSKKINTMETPVLNIGNPKTITLTKFINILEKNLSKKSKKKFLRRQPGDVLETKAIINFERKKLKLLFETELGEGINRFVNWHNNYH